MALNGFGPSDGYPLGMSVTECPTQAGLLVTDVVEMGNAAMCGMERGDIITTINGQVPWRVSNLTEATSQKNTDRMVLRVLSKNRETFEIVFPIPLKQPEAHFCGLLFEKDPPTGQFVVTGVVRGSEAANVHFPMWSILSRVNDVATAGKSESELRKLLYGKGGEFVQIGSQPPGWPSIIDVQFPRLNHIGPAPAFDNYCDGWSEKAFDEEYCSAKASNWLDSNPPHLAEHRYEHDQVPCLHDEIWQPRNDWSTKESFGGEFDSDGVAAASSNDRTGGHLNSWIQETLTQVRERQALSDHQIRKAIGDATDQISEALSALQADHEQRRRDRLHYRELTQQLENLQKTVALLQAAGQGSPAPNGSHGSGRLTT